MSFADVVSRVTHTISLFGQILIRSTCRSDHDNTRFPGTADPHAGSAGTDALLQLALSRTREYNADLYAVRLAGDPDGLASALAKMEGHQRKIEQGKLPGRSKTDPSLLRTHPPTEERIRRLRGLAAEMDVLYPNFNHSAEREELPSRFPPVKQKPRRRLTGLWH